MPKQPGEPTDRRDSEPELPPGMNWDWFCGEGSTETGEIMRVIFSAELYETDNGRFGKDMEEWKHYTGNQKVKDSSGIEAVGLRRMLQEIEEYVFQKTGFTPRQLIDQARIFEISYRGKRQAPFLIETLLSAKEAGEEAERDIAKKKAEILQRLISPEELPMPLRFFVAIVKDGIIIDVDYSDEVRNTIGEENLKQAISIVMQSSTGLSGEKLKAYNRRLEPADKLFIDRIGFTFTDLITKRGLIERTLRGKKTDLLPEGIVIKIKS